MTLLLKNDRNLLLNQLLQKIYVSFIKQLFNKTITNFKIYKANELELRINDKYIYSLIYFLKFNNLTQCKFLIDIVISDYIGKKYRFSITYLLLSIFNYRIKINCLLKETNNLLSIISLFNNATWLEREIYDFYGILFIYNIDLRRILNDYGFIGYPLRKDFPLIGFNEIVYDDIKKQIIINKIELNQILKKYNLFKIWT